MSSDSDSDYGDIFNDCDYADIFTDRYISHYICSSAKSYVILKEDDLIERQQQIIHEVASVLTLSTNDACMLLSKYDWCVTYLYDAWFEDARKVCDDIGLKMNVKHDHDVKFPKHDIRKVQCGICFDSVRFDETANCGCDHIICKECWRSYVSTAINEGPGCLTLKCPEPSCGASVGPDMVKVLANEKEKKIYDRFWLRSYVKSSKKIKWCPGPGCDNAVEFDDNYKTDSYNVTCDCKHTFCWKCLEEAHSPLDCETVGKWVMKNMAEAENICWILANAKPCPNCKQWIERYAGCTIMKCIQPCGYEFCWLCLDSSSGHKYTACSRKRDEVSEKCELAKKSIDRYPHYYERWAANEKYRKQALVDLHTFEKTVSLEKISPGPYLHRNDLMYITDAWLQIVECRRVLKWAYAYGNYYIPKEEEAKTVFFDYVLGEAEVSLERLQLYAEKELQTCIESGFGLKQVKSYVVELANLTSVTRTYFQNLVRAIENGLSEIASLEDVKRRTLTSSDQGDAAGRLNESFNGLNLQV